MKTTRSDWAQTAGSVKWANVKDKPDSFGISDIGQLTAAGFGVGKVPLWNGSNFIPGDLPDIPATPASTGEFAPLNLIGVATVRQPPGFTYGPTEKVIFQEVFDVRQYGAFGNSAGYDDSEAFNHAIADINANGQGVLFVPYGYYRAGNLSEIRVPCSIIGAGVGATSINFSGSGFSGGASGSWFEVAGMQLISSGTAGYGISLTDGSNSGMFSFHDLDIRHFNTPIIVTASQRRGFIFNSRIDPIVTGISLSAKESILANIMMVNDASTATRAISLSGSYHEIHSLKAVAGSARWNQGILANSGTGGKVSNSLFSGVANECVDLSDGSSGTTGWRVENLTFFDCTAANPVRYNRDKHYVNELQGLGSNTNTDFDSRRELFGTAVWDPPVLRPLESVFEEFYVLGCKIGDQVAVGAPYDIDYLQISAKVRAPDVIRCTLTNGGPSTINPASGTYKFRAFN